MDQKDEDVYIVDGESLTPEKLLELAKGDVSIKLSDGCYRTLLDDHAFLTDLVEKRLSSGVSRAADSHTSVYGINTGVGPFVDRLVGEDKWMELQQNVIRSHACAIGEPISIERTRAILLSKVNSLAKGHTGVRASVMDKLIAYFNASCLPHVPGQGAGDFRSMHLAHLILGYTGEGQMWSPKTSWTHSDKVMKFNGLDPLVLQPKEAVTLISGAHSITALACEVLVRAEILAKQADVIAALLIEALRASKTISTAFRPEINGLRPHTGQFQSAQRIRALIRSEIFESDISKGLTTRVLEVNSLQATPQVHGMALDTLRFVRGILTTELNCVSDGSMIFENAAGKRTLIFGGNDHGAYPSRALSFVMTSLVDMASISEQRTARLFGRAREARLRAGLVSYSGADSGLIMLHTLAVELLGEAKVLATPCFGALPSEMDFNDHQSIGSVTARHALQVVDLTEKILAVELICATQAMSNHQPWQTTMPLQAVVNMVNEKIPVLEEDVVMSDKIGLAKEMICYNRLWASVKRHVVQFALSTSEPTVKQGNEETAETFNDMRSPKGSIHADDPTGFEDAEQRLSADDWEGSVERYL